MEEFLDQYGYVALLIGSFFEGETAILIASSLIYRGFFETPYTIFFAFAGSFISDWIYYLIGRLNGKYFINERPKLKARLQPVQHFFENHKMQILFSYRFLYGFRVIIPLIIGMSSIRPLQYLLYSIASGLIWAATVSLIGYSIGRFLDIRTSIFEENLFFIIVAFATFGILIGYTIKKIAFKKMVEAGKNA